MSRSETAAHLHLKKLALDWAQAKGYVACGIEVRLPSCGYRADVVAYKPGTLRTEVEDARTRQPRSLSVPVVGTTAIFECKQIKADFLRDGRLIDRTASRLKSLDERRLTLERLLKLHYPSLRQGDSLFQDFESYDLTRIDHAGYHRVIREIEWLKSRLYDKTKFEKLVRYRCANLFYVVVEQGVVEGHELPVGWGLLEHREGTLELRRKPIWQEAPEANRLALLQRIAVSGTRRLNREFQPTDGNVTEH